MDAWPSTGHFYDNNKGGGLGRDITSLNELEGGGAPYVEGTLSTLSKVA